jgi:hypothetical protein
MKELKYALCALLMILLAGTAFAQQSCQLEKDSQVLVTSAAPGQDTLLNISVLTFQSSATSGGPSKSDLVAQWYKECNNDVACVTQKAQEASSTDTSYKVTVESLKDARIVVSYSANGQYNEICNELTNKQGAALPQIAGAPVQYVYYTQCDISSAVKDKTRVQLKVDFGGTPTVCPSVATPEYVNAHVNASSAFADSINNFITGISNSGGQGTINGAGPLPCVGVFLILGLLMASLYFAGKSPVSLLDITTPKLPTPKGVTAGGQILTPFGYNELSKTVNKKLAAAQAGMAASQKVLEQKGGTGNGTPGSKNPLGNNAEYRRQQDEISKLKDKAAKAEGSLAREQGAAKSINALAHAVGDKEGAAMLSKKLPYHYGDAEQKKVAQILEAAEKMGGREKLMAMTVKDYLLSERTMQTLDVLASHPDIGKKSVAYSRFSSTLGKMYGSNRYNVLSGVVMAGSHSTVRTGRMIGRMGKAIVTETPSAVRAVAKTTMEMKVFGGPRAMEELAVKAKTSQTSAWIYGQLLKKPSEPTAGSIGSMFPINDKMGHLYKTLHNETIHDEMRYVLKQLYKKAGMRFDVSEEELTKMGFVDMDILQRSGFSAAVASMDVDVRRILSNTAFTASERLTALRDLAERHGAFIDPHLTNFTERVSLIAQSGQPEHIKGIMLNQLLEEQNSIRMAGGRGGKVNDDAYVCHVGGESLRGSQIWETMLFRTMTWDGENGYLKGGIKEELLSARLNIANREATLNPEEAAKHGGIPSYALNAGELRKVADRNRSDMIQLFSEEGKAQFAQANGGKSMANASISELVHFMYGGTMTRSGTIDKKTGRMTWYASDLELSLPKEATLVDMKRHWISGGDDPKYGESHKDLAVTLGGFVEGRFTKSYIPPFKASLEAEADRMAGSSSWSEAERTTQMKKLWLKDQLLSDMEQRFNSQFGQNTYGTTRETMRFYGGIMAGFMDKALQDKGMELNHPDRAFLKDMDYTNPKHLMRLADLQKTYAHEYHEVVSKPMTYDGIANSKKAVVEMYGGGYAYYSKGMMLSDGDRIMAGEASMRDNKGQLRKFIPEDVTIAFAGRDDLYHQYLKVRSSKDPAEWQGLMEAAGKWSDSGAYDYDKKKVYAAVCWQYSTTTGNYEHFWKTSGVSVEAKRQVTPLAPSVLRNFGYEGTKAGEIMKPFRDIAMHGGDYISKVALASGGPVLRTSFDITPISSQLRMHSFQLANSINSGKILEGLTGEEKAAYRNVAAQHGAYVQVWQYAIDRNPWVMSKSFGAHQAWESAFNMGPGVPFKVKDNLRAYMGKGEYAGFMSLYGFPMDLAGKIMKPYISMMRGMQQSMQGYASSWDMQGDALRQYNYTEPRLLEAMQSLNPFASKWMPGKTGDRIAKLNMFGGSLEQHQLAGEDYLTGLKQGPSHIFQKRKGVYAHARTGDVNPGETDYNYRMEMHAAQPMAEYLYRTKEASFIYDKNLQEDALNNTMRRTVSAEALAIRRDQEMRGFGILQNSLFGWASPLGFLWHNPAVPGMSPRDSISKMVARSKTGQGGSWLDGVRNLGTNLKTGTSRLVQPHKTAMVVYCPKCGMSNYRGSRCKNPSCKQVLY